jgi:hypothetical protein
MSKTTERKKKRYLCFCVSSSLRLFLPSDSLKRLDEEKWDLNTRNMKKNQKKKLETQIEFYMLNCILMFSTKESKCKIIQNMKMK